MLSTPVAVREKESHATSSSVSTNTRSCGAVSGFAKTCMSADSLNTRVDTPLSRQPFRWIKPQVAQSFPPLRRGRLQYPPADAYEKCYAGTCFCSRPHIRGQHGILPRAIHFDWPSNFTLTIDPFGGEKRRCRRISHPNRRMQCGRFYCYGIAFLTHRTRVRRFADCAFCDISPPSTACRALN